MRNNVTIVIALLLCLNCQDSSSDDSASDTSTHIEDINDPKDDDSEEPDVVDPAILLTQGLDLINEHRAMAGLDALVENDDLSAGCLNHVRYMAVEGKLTHNEDIHSDWYTNAGAKAGVNALIAGPVTSLSEAVEFWLLSVYHRLTLLDPGVQGIGVAFEANYACLDLLSEYEEQEDHAAVRYPTTDQTNVPTAFANYQGLSPLPEDYSDPSGYIVSLLFAPKAFVSPEFTGTITLEGADEPLEAFVRTPNDPSDKYAKYQRNAVTLIPKDILLPNQTYNVQMTGQVNEELFDINWQFTTQGPITPGQ